MILPEFYTTCLAKYLSPSQLLTLEILVWLLQVHKQVRIERLTRLVLLIAIAYTCACLKGDKTQRSGQQKYVCRLKELKRTQRRHSNFWIGLYGQMWIIGWEFCRGWIEQLMQLSRNKLPYFQQGLKAMEQIQAVS